MMKNNIYLLIHGPYEINNLVEIRKSLSASRVKYTDIKKIIFVVYNNSYTKVYLKAIDLLFSKAFCVQFIIVNDILNPGFFNINRQVISVSQGLKEVPNSNDIVIKLRIDQYPSFRHVLKYIKKYRQELGKKILTTSAYSMKYRLYHPSDMFLISSKQNLEKYYSLEYQKQTHLDVVLQYHKKYKRLSYPPITFSPETLLFKKFLTENGWIIQHTEKDSQNAIKQYIIIVDPWDISLKTRAQKMKTKKHIILPNTHIFLRSDMDHIIQTCYYSKEKSFSKFWKNLYYKGIIYRKTFFFLVINRLQKLERRRYRNPIFKVPFIKKLGKSLRKWGE